MPRVSRYRMVARSVATGDVVDTLDEFEADNKPLAYDHAIVCASYASGLQWRELAISLTFLGFGTIEQAEKQRQRVKDRDAHADTQQ
jgi:hypothetical protein